MGLSGPVITRNSFESACRWSANGILLRYRATPSSRSSGSIRSDVNSLSTWRCHRGWWKVIPILWLRGSIIIASRHSSNFVALTSTSLLSTSTHGTGSSLAGWTSACKLIWSRLRYRRPNLRWIRRSYLRTCWQGLLLPQQVHRLPRWHLSPARLRLRRQLLLHWRHNATWRSESVYLWEFHRPIQRGSVSSEQTWVYLWRRRHLRSLYSTSTPSRPLLHVRFRLPRAARRGRRHRLVFFEVVRALLHRRLQSRQWRHRRAGHRAPAVKVQWRAAARQFRRADLPCPPYLSMNLN